MHLLGAGHLLGQIAFNHITPIQFGLFLPCRVIFGPDHFAPGQLHLYPSLEPIAGEQGLGLFERTVGIGPRLLLHLQIARRDLGLHPGPLVSAPSPFSSLRPGITPQHVTLAVELHLRRLVLEKFQLQTLFGQ